MNDDSGSVRYLRAQAIAHAVADQSPAERSARLDALCDGDAALRAEVDWLLAAIESGADDSTPAAIEAMSRSLLAEQRIEAVAPREYRLLERIGRGGMGQVWLAERTAGGVRQRVALKMLRGADRPAERELARFIAEGRILASLQHPNIAHLIDAGADADGLPFLAMEYVDGERIDRWCAARAMTLRQRIALFIRVCAAVEYAHGRLVIHRDLKPANILIAADGEPKLLDFGIARLLPQADGPAAATTIAHAMTPAYASPEQIEGAALGTATDIYSLGVVLYELLTGVRPFDHIANPHERSNAAISGSITPPSRTHRPPAATEVAVPRVGAQRIPADVDAIVLKALRREPAQRYASVGEFAADLRRFLAAQPVLARKGQLGYRMRRFTWRNRWPIAVAVAVAALASGFTWRTVLAEREARLQAETSDRVVAFLESIFAAADANLSDKATHELTAREVLAEGTDRISRELAGEPRIRARLLETVGNAYRHMEERDIAARLLREAADLNLSPAVDQPLAAARCLEALANTMANGSFPAADIERAARESLALAERLAGPESQEAANAWMVLSLALNRSGHYAGAVDAARTTLAMNERYRDQPDNRFDAAENNLCLIQGNRGRFAEASEICTRKLERGRATADPFPWFTLRADANNRLRTGDATGALERFSQMLDYARQREGDAGPFLSDTHAGMATALDALGRYPEALAQVERALAMASQDGERELLHGQLGRHHASAGTFDRALPLLRDGLAAIRRRYSDDDPRVLNASTVLAATLLDSGVADVEVRRLLDQALAGWAGKDDPGTYFPNLARIALARWLARNGDAQAGSLLAQIEATPELAFLIRAEVPAIRADGARHAGRWTDAIDQEARYREVLRERLAADHPLLLRSELRAAADLGQAGRTAEAAALERALYPQLAAKLPADSAFLHGGEAAAANR